MTPIEVAIALLPAAAAGFAIGWFARGLRSSADRAELVALRGALNLPSVRDMLLEKGLRVGAISGKVWAAQDAAAALGSADSVQELAALSDDLLPRQEPGLPGIGPLRRGKPPWRELAEQEGLLPAENE